MEFETQDRVGYSVVLEDGGVRIATEDDAPDDIIGAISGNAATIKGTAWKYWAQKYVTDDFNRPVFGDIEVVSWTAGYVANSEGVPQPFDVWFYSWNCPTEPPEDAKREMVSEKYLNPAWDATQAKGYVGRQDRPEWAKMAHAGTVAIRNGQITGDRWKQMSAVSPTITEWWVR